jgi:hypothetical protein
VNDHPVKISRRKRTFSVAPAGRDVKIGQGFVVFGVSGVEAIGTLIYRIHIHFSFLL